MPKDRKNGRMAATGGPRPSGKLPVRIMAANGSRIVYLDDPREAYCRHYNQLNRQMGNGSRATIVREGGAA